MPQSAATYDPTNPTPYQAPALPAPSTVPQSPLPPPQTPDFGGTAPTKSGGIASILDNVMRGVMQGRTYAKQNEAASLATATQSSQALYNMAAQNLQGLVESYNVPPEQVQALLKNPTQAPQGMDPAVFAQLKNAANVVNHSWGNIQKLYGSQVMPQGKKGKSKSQDQQNPLQMVTSTDPQEKLQGLYQLWSKMPPPVYGSLYQAAQNASFRAQQIKTIQGQMTTQQTQDQLDTTYLGAKNEKNQIIQGKWQPPQGSSVTQEERVKQLDKTIDEYEKMGTGSWKPIEYMNPQSGEHQTYSQNGKTGQWMDGLGQPVSGPPGGWVVAPKASSTPHPAKPTWKGNTLVDVVDPTGKTWTPAEMSKGQGGEEVQALYHSAIAAQDTERKAAADKSAQWYAHADYSNHLQVGRMIDALNLKVNAADIGNWKKLDDTANTNEGMYQRAIKQSYPAPTATSEQALLISWVRSNVAGAGRLNTTEIQQGLRSGSYGLKAQNAWDVATTGTLAPELHNDFVNDIRNAAQASREEADKYKTEHNIADADLDAIAEAEKKSATPASKGFVDVASAMSKPKYKGKPEAEIVKEIKAQGYTPTKNGKPVE